MTQKEKKPPMIHIQLDIEWYSDDAEGNIQGHQIAVVNPSSIELIDTILQAVSKEMAK